MSSMSEDSEPQQTSEGGEPQKKGSAWGCLGLVLVPVLLVGGCFAIFSGGDDEDDSPAAQRMEEAVGDADGEAEEVAEDLTADEPPAGQDLVSDEQIGRAAFLLAMRDTDGVVDGVSDDTLLTAGEAVCTAFDAGASPGDVLLASIEDAPEAAPLIIGAAANSLCPEYSEMVMDFASGLG